MAVVRYGPNVLDLSGSIGNLTFSKWKGLPYVRSKANTVDNPQSVTQVRQRAAISELSKIWWKILTPPQRANWESMAEQIGSAYNAQAQSEGGQGIIKPGGLLMSGYNAFIRCNLERESVGYSHVDHVLRDAPLGIDPPSPPHSLDLAYNLETECIEGSVTKPSEAGDPYRWDKKTGEEVEQPTVVRLWLAPPSGFPRIQEILSIEYNNGVNFICACTYREYDEEKPLYPGLWRLQADAVSGYGLRSSPSELAAVMVPLLCDLPDMDIAAFTYGTPPAGFTAEFTKACVDDAGCKADFVHTMFFDHVAGEWHELFFPREQWTANALNYSVFIPWETPAAGTYKLRMCSDTDGGAQSVIDTAEYIYAP